MLQRLLSGGIVTGIAALSAAPLAWGVTSVNRVVSYTPGTPVQTAWWNASLTFTVQDAVKGLPTGHVGYDPFTGISTGALTPFNPPFHPDHIVRVSAGGSMEVQLSTAVAVTAGRRELGVFTNNGIIDVTPGTLFDENFVCIAGGTGTAPTYTSSPQEIVFSSSPKSLVFVKEKESDAWTPVNGGNPVTFDVPTNAYTDTAIDKLVAPLGSVSADFGKPFEGTLGDFAGKNYIQMLSMLNGSAGGTWLDLDSTGLNSVQFVKFEVPAGADYRMMLDAVTASPTPEPGGVLAVAVAAIAGLRRRR